MAKLTVKLLEKLGAQPRVVNDIGLVIVESEGVPFCVAMSLGPQYGGATYVGHVRDKDFNAMLQQLGLDTLVLVEDGKKLLLPDDQLPPAENFRLPPNA